MSNNLNPLYEFSFRKLFGGSSEKAAYKETLEKEFERMKLAFKEKALQKEAERLEKYAKEIADLKKENLSTTRKLAYAGIGLAGVKSLFKNPEVPDYDYKGKDKDDD